MPYQQIPGTDQHYALISFDKRGRERTDDPEGVNGVFSKALLAAIIDQKPTDVFFYSHGWKGDVPSAIDQYNRWIKAMWDLQQDRAAMGNSFRPMFVGLHWPSQPWGDEAFPEEDSGVSFDLSADITVEPNLDEAAERLFDEAVDQFGDSDEVRAALEVIFGQWKENPSGLAVPAESLAAYTQLAEAIGFQSGGGPEGPPDEEGAELDPQAAAAATRILEAGSSFGIGGGIKRGILGGLRQLSFWTMKRRARSIGEGGMHSFLKEVLAGSDAHIHLMGHSFGCVVVSSILGGPGGKGTFSRPVTSATLVQGAVSLWSWASQVKERNQPGYFRSVVEKGWVAGPVLTTRSVKDRAVGLAYPAAVALVGQASFDPDPPANDYPLFGGTGAYGLQGTGISSNMNMLPADQSYPFEKGKVYNLQANDYIPSHNGIDGPEVAHSIWEAARIGRS